MGFLKKKEKRVPEDEIAGQLDLADRISRRVIHSASAIDIVKGAIKDLRQYMNIEWSALSLVKESSQQLEVQIITENDEVTTTSIQLSGTPVFWVISNKQALSQRDAQSDVSFPNKFFSVPNLRVLIHMPLFYQGSVYGVLSVGNYKSSTYMDGQLRLLKHSVAHLGISVKSALLMERNIKTEQQLVDLNELTTIITSNPELTQVLPDFVGRLNKILKVDRMMISVVEGRRLRLVADYNGEGKYPQPEDLIETSQTSVPWLEEHRTIIVESDIESDKKFDIDDAYLKDGYKGLIRIPLFIQKRLIGVVIFLAHERYQLDEEMGFLNQLASYVVAPIESYLLYLHEQQRIDWLSALSHYLRTPLTPILASSKMLSMQMGDSTDSKLAKLVTNIGNSAEKMKEYLELFWDLSEIEAGDFAVNISSVDLAQLLDEVVKNKTSIVEAKGQKLELELPQQFPEVSADYNRVKQVVNYLLGLAIDRSPKKSAIGLKVVADAEKVKIEITGSAATLSDDEIESLMKPYDYAEADMKSHPKLTLITIICTRLAHFHGGHFWIEPNPGGGNRYLFSIPTS